MNCPSCEQMKKENKMLRSALTETNKHYVEVVNENLELRRQLERANERISTFLAN